MRSHIRVVKGLLVLLHCRLPVVGCYLMATVVTQATGQVGSAKILLPTLVKRRVVGPGIVPPDTVVLEVSAVGGGIGHPKGGLVGLVVEEAVVADHLAVVLVGVRYNLLIEVRSVVAASLRTSVGFGKGVVAVAAGVLCAAHTHCRSVRSRHLVVGEPGAEALGCEALGTAVEGADCRALVSRALDLGVGAIVVGRAWSEVAESFAEGFSGGADIAADNAACQRT